MIEPKTNQTSFFGDYIYDRIIPSNHFLKKLNIAIDFSFVNKLCKKLYADIGRPGILPEKMFKILLLQFLYDISDRRIIEEVRYNIVFKWFVGLEIDQEPPDSSSLTRFMDRLGPKKFAKIFNTIVNHARENGLISDKLSIIDTTDVKAKVDTFRMKDKEPKDPDASSGYKTKNKPFFGYKSHASMDNDSNIVTKLDLTSGNVFDGTYFKELVDNKSQTITADKAYDNNENHTYLKKHNIKSAIIVKRNRIKKEIIKNSKLISIQTSQRQRPNIERKFAELKNLHGLSKARYWGLSKVYIQSCLSAIAVNIKRIVRLLFDIPLFNPIGLVSLFSSLIK